MMNIEREEVIKSVILVLLGEDLRKKQSLQENLQEGVDRETARVAVGRDVAPASYAAVEVIVSKMDLSHGAIDSVVDFAIGKCLEIYEKGKSDFMGVRGIDALDAATHLISYGASREMIEKVIGAVAEHGWYGRIEGLTQKLLDRGLTPAEVKALVRHYVNDRGCRSQDTEKRLLEMAQKYLSPEEAAEVTSQIQHFITEFEEQDWG